MDILGKYHCLTLDFPHAVDIMDSKRGGRKMDDRTKKALISMLAVSAVAFLILLVALLVAP
jgi:hypothetical protein